MNTKPQHSSRHWKTPWMVSLLVFLLMSPVLAYCAYYLISGYTDLRQAYLGLNDCFYRASFWDQELFTPSVKAQGNWFAWLAISICVLLSSMPFWGLTPPRLGNWRSQLRILFGYFKGEVLILLAIGVVLWGWSNALAPPSTDEVFSAMYFAELPWFQRMAHYPLPNNHIAFNLVNGFLGSTTPDLVTSGRVLSLPAYCLVLWLGYLIFRRLGIGLYPAFLMSLVVGLQFSTWAFAAQARGYAWYATAHWMCFYSVWAYVTGEVRIRRWLLGGGVFLGYSMVPSFLYFHLSLVAFLLLKEIWDQKFRLELWVPQMVALCLVFFLYLPALGFSGIEALVSNRYVAPMGGDMATFAPRAWEVFKTYPAYAFSGLELGEFRLSLILFLLPVLLLLFPAKDGLRSLGLFYLLLILGVVLTVLVMKRYPFHRNLLGHFSLILALSLLAWQATWALMGKLVRARVLTQLPSIVGVIGLGLYFLWANPDRIEQNELYYYDLDALYSETEYRMEQLLGKGTIAVSEEAFYCRYVLEEKDALPLICEGGFPDWYVKTKDEALPEAFEDNAVRRSSFRDCEVYELIRE